jgi:signal transduction histidine kinase
MPAVLSLLLAPPPSTPPPPLPPPPPPPTAALPRWPRSAQNAAGPRVAPENDMTTNETDPAAPIDPLLGRRGRLAFWGALAGTATAAVDVTSMAALGVRFEMNGTEVGWLVGLFFGSSFAILGGLVGAQIESRRRERRAAEIIREQREAIHATKSRLAQNEKLASLGQLAAAIAHEVRNPLAVIRSSAQNLAESLATPETTRATSFILAEIDRLSKVVTSLLAFARPLHLEPRLVTPADLVGRAALLAGEDLAARRIRLETRIAADLAPVRADPDLVCQVLLGLLGNAALAVDGAGEIEIEAHAVEGGVEVVVADTGPGVPAEIRGRIFDPFFTTRSRGVGLGLAVAREIVEAHGGRIEVGARFAIRLPSAVGAAA